MKKLPALAPVPPASPAYTRLRRLVQETFALAQVKNEAARVRIYWKTGQLIDKHLQRHGSREALYGKQVVSTLAQDLDVGSALLWRCVQFAKEFDFLAHGRESFAGHLAWLHYRRLITVRDEDTRIDLMRRAEQGKWTALELATKIQQEVHMALPVAGRSSGTSNLNAKRGLPYTYRLVAPKGLQAKVTPGLWIDLGFQIHRTLPVGKPAQSGNVSRRRKGAKMSEGAIVESVTKRGAYSVLASDRTDEDLYTYHAQIERVVDGDTLLAVIDLGFQTRIRHYLRLRGLDAPELDTADGKKAKTFVERALAKVGHVLITSSRSDKYARYLADVYYGKQDGEYLNQRLLDEGLAERM